MGYLEHPWALTEHLRCFISSKMNIQGFLHSSNTAWRNSELLNSISRTRLRAGNFPWWKTHPKLYLARSSLNKLALGDFPAGSGNDSSSSSPQNRWFCCVHAEFLAPVSRGNTSLSREATGSGLMEKAGIIPALGILGAFPLAPCSTNAGQPQGSNVVAFPRFPAPKWV